MRAPRRRLLRTLAASLPAASLPAAPGAAMAQPAPHGAAMAQPAPPGPASTQPAAARPATAPATAAAAPAWDPVLPGVPMRFPRDHGAHPGHRTEWWYVTGWLQRPGAADCGFQVTFFRSRTAHPDANPSRFAPRQLVLAHAALALPERARLVHAERAARAVFEQAGASETDTRAWIGAGTGAWSLARDPASGTYSARIDARELGMSLELSPPGPPLLQGDAGFSRKGPRPLQASGYYSRPQLAVTGTVRTGADPATTVSGSAWFDHEWSSEILDPDAAGWDWAGLNLDDGGALMAFRIRGRDGREHWREAMLRDGAEGRVRTGLAPRFEPVRTWRSPRTGARWPVEMRIEVDGRTIELRPLFDDQELDARGSTGTTYWEGAVTAFERGRRIGRGYLELTGYAGAIRL
jgi:predicted secreted hydrolase